MSINKVKGDAYEKYILNKYKTDYDNVWLWPDIPEYILRKFNLIPVNRPFSGLDVGIDIVAIKDDKIDLIQCKNYNNSVCKDDIAGFLWFLMMHNNKTHNISAILCYSKSVSGLIMDDLQIYNETMNIKIKLRHHPFDNNTILNSMPIITNGAFILRDYQLKALEVNTLTNNKKIVNDVPCGLGKTYIASQVAKKYDNVIVIAPLKLLAEDLLNNISGHLGNEYNINICRW